LAILVITPFRAYLGAPVGRIYDPIININSISGPNSVLSLDIVISIKDTSVLISLQVIYISRDIIFDEAIFPFASLHSNVGAQLRQEIDLLHLS
jgi:hypothetical protein